MPTLTPWELQDLNTRMQKVAEALDVDLPIGPCPSVALRMMCDEAGVYVPPILFSSPLQLAELICSDELPDPVPYVLSSPSATILTLLDLSVATDGNDGTIYWVVTASATKPTAVQISDGQDHLGAAALADDEIAVTHSGTHTASTSVDAFDPGSYYAHFTHLSGQDAFSSVVSSSAVTVA